MSRKTRLEDINSDNIFFIFSDSASNCEDIEYSNFASSKKNLWYPIINNELEIYFSTEACMPENIKESTGKIGF